MGKQKEKLDKTWFEPDQLIWLNGSMPSPNNKTKIKEELDKLNIKWTIKCSPDVTKIISTDDGRYIINYPTEAETERDETYIRVGESNVVNPRRFMTLVKNMTATDMSEYSIQVLDLLKSMDEINIDLACTLIGDSLIEDKWLPWLMINKHLDSVKELIVKNNIPRGSWRIENTKDNFMWACRDLKNRLNISDDYMNEFIVEFYNKIKQ